MHMCVTMYTYVTVTHVRKHNIYYNVCTMYAGIFIANCIAVCTYLLIYLVINTEIPICMDK